jgi:protein-tyrosine phosphatase
MTPKVICFLCTGNYYRSRYAEECFNHQAHKAGLQWRATSRALHQDLSTVRNVGSMSPVAIVSLWLKGIRPRQAQRAAQTLGQAESSQFSRLVALDAEEHTPYVETYYPALKGKMIYWDIKDLDKESPKIAFAKIDRHVQRLIETLAGEP